MKKYISMILMAAVSIIGSADAYIFEKDIAYTSKIMQGMNVNFADALAMWRTGALTNMRTKGNVVFEIQKPGRDLVDAKNQGLDSIMSLLITLFPSNGGELAINTSSSVNFASAMRKLSLKAQAQIIANLLLAGKEMKNQNKKLDDSQKILKGKLLTLLDREVKNGAQFLLDEKAIPEGELNVPKAITKIGNLVCNSFDFERRIPAYMENTTETIILAFCCFFFDGLGGVEALLNEFIAEGLIDYKPGYTAELPVIEEDEYIRRMVALYQKTNNMSPLVSECESVLYRVMPYNEFQQAFFGKKDKLSRAQQIIKSSNVSPKKLELAKETMTQTIRETLIEKNVAAGISSQLSNNLSKFFTEFDWENETDFRNSKFWNEFGIEEFLGNPFDATDLVSFLKANRDNGDAIFLKIKGLLHQGNPLLKDISHLARFYSFYPEKRNSYLEEIGTTAKEYVKKKEKRWKEFLKKNGRFFRGEFGPGEATRQRLQNCFRELLTGDFKNRHLSLEQLLSYKAGETSDVVPYPTSGNFDEGASMVVEGEKFSDCVETAIRHLITMMCEYDSKNEQISVPNTFNERTIKFFQKHKYSDEHNSGSSEIHKDWVYLFRNLPNYVKNDIKKCSDGDLDSTVSNIKNALAFLTTTNEEEYDKLKDEGLADILMNGRKDVKFNVKSDYKEKNYEISVVPQEENSKRHEFNFVLRVESGHSGLRGKEAKDSVDFSYELLNLSQDTSRLYAQYACFPNIVHAVFFLDDARKTMQRPAMNYFVESTMKEWKMDETISVCLPEIHKRKRQNEFAEWLFSFMKSNKRQNVVSILQEILDNFDSNIITELVSKKTTVENKDNIKEEAINRFNKVLDHVYDEFKKVSNEFDLNKSVTDSFEKIFKAIADNSKGTELAILKAICDASIDGTANLDSSDRYSREEELLSFRRHLEGLNGDFDFHEEVTNLFGRIGCDSDEILSNAKVTIDSIESTCNSADEVLSATNIIAVSNAIISLNCLEREFDNDPFYIKCDDATVLVDMNEKYKKMFELIQCDDMQSKILEYSLARIAEAKNSKTIGKAKKMLQELKDSKFFYRVKKPEYVAAIEYINYTDPDLFQKLEKIVKIKGRREISYMDMVLTGCIDKINSECDDEMRAEYIKVLNDAVESYGGRKDKDDKRFQVVDFDEHTFEHAEFYLKNFKSLGEICSTMIKNEHIDKSQKWGMVNKLIKSVQSGKYIENIICDYLELINDSEKKEPHIDKLNSFIDLVQKGLKKSNQEKLVISCNSDSFLHLECLRLHAPDLFNKLTSVIQINVGGGILDWEKAHLNEDYIAKVLTNRCYWKRSGDLASSRIHAATSILDRYKNNGSVKLSVNTALTKFLSGLVERYIEELGKNNWEYVNNNREELKCLLNSLKDVMAGDQSPLRLSNLAPEDIEHLRYSDIDFLNTISPISSFEYKSIKEESLDKLLDNSVYVSLFIDDTLSEITQDPFERGKFDRETLEDTLFVFLECVKDKNPKISISRIHNIIKLLDSKLFDKIRSVVKLEKDTKDTEDSNNSKVLSVDEAILDPNILRQVITHYVDNRKAIHRRIVGYGSIDDLSSDGRNELTTALEKEKAKFNKILDLAITNKNSKGFLFHENVVIDSDEDDTLWKELPDDRDSIERLDALVRINIGKKKMLVSKLIDSSKK